jgi:Cu+-exporting ATPase
VGALRIRVRAAGRHAYLRQVVEIVREAQAKKAPIQRVADSMAEGFSMAVLVLAGVTFGLWAGLGTGGEAVWTAVWRGLTVLVVACPCALGLATPVAVLVGSGSAARRGILFRSGAALEALSRTRVVVLDKTGTLTSGRMEVVEWWERESFGKQVIGWVAEAEQQSAHPVAGAVARFARELGWVAPRSDETEVALVPGCGIRARVGAVRLSVGNSVLMHEDGVVLPGEEIGGEKGGERIWVGVDGEFAGWFRVADPVRPEAPEVVGKLRAAGFRVILLSGDREEIAQRVAREVGIEEVRAGVLPEQKQAEVERLQQAGLAVLMVGDGVNDAPALAQADVGVAMGGGTAVARHTAEVTLACGHLNGLWEALEIAEKTLRVIRQNLGFAMGYNLLALPVAAGATAGLGWMPGPMLASAAMALSSVSVVLNALRLRRLGGRPGR